MLRGLLALALAICVTGAPVTTGLCEAVCATRSADAANHSSGPHHSCHTEAPLSGVSLIAVHGCGHTDELPGCDRPPEQVTAAVAIMPSVAVVGPEIRVTTAQKVAVQFSPPPPPASSSQLRV